MPDPATRDAIAAKTRELLALRVDHNGHPAPAAPAPVDLTSASPPAQAMTAPEGDPNAA
ncbi:hypothetical protein [Micromonospora sp. NPDC005161]